MATMKDLRLEAGMTIFELASASRVSTATISRVEAGPHALHPLVAQRLLRTLSERIGRQITIEDIEGLEIASRRGRTAKQRNDTL